MHAQRLTESSDVSPNECSDCSMAQEHAQSVRIHTPLETCQEGFILNQSVCGPVHHLLRLARMEVEHAGGYPVRVPELVRIRHLRLLFVMALEHSRKRPTLAIVGNKRHGEAWAGHSPEELAHVRLQRRTGGVGRRGAAGSM